MSEMRQVSRPLVGDPFEKSVSGGARIGLALAIITALVICGFLFAAASVDVDRFYSPDSDEYVDLGRNLSAYLNPDDPLFRFGTNRTPGYPVLIAATFAVLGDRVQYVIAVQIVLFIGSLYLTFRIGTLLAGSSCGAIAACVLALNPESNVYAVYLMNETFFTTAILLAAWIWLVSLRKPGSGLAFLAGLGFGAATLIRPAGMYLPVLLAPFFFFGACRYWAKALKVALFALGVGLPIGGWMAHHYALTGTAFVTIIQSKELLYSRAAGAVAAERDVERRVAAAALAEQLWAPHGVRVSATERKQITHWLSQFHWPHVSQFFERRSLGGDVVDRYRLMAEEKRLALQVLLTHPVGAIKSAGFGAVRLLAGPGTHNALRLIGIDSERRDSAWYNWSYAVLILPLMGFVYLSATAGLVWLWRTKQYGVAFSIGVFVVYFAVVVLGPTAYSRFRVPFMPFVSILAAIGIVAWIRRRRRQSAPAV